MPSLCLPQGIKSMVVKWAKQKEKKEEKEGERDGESQKSKSRARLSISNQNRVKILSKDWNGQKRCSTSPERLPS